ncbi:MAG: hypothetical protein GY928_03845 [Colwellia sp.]|nr:hypothetical protein [Colwellia sp.]
MRDKIDFSYNLYIGKHMEKPLKVKYRNLHSDNVVGCLTGVNRDYLFIKNGGVEDIEIYTKHCKPHLKLPEDLTDEEWLFIYFGDNLDCNLGMYIKRDSWSCINAVDKFGDIGNSFPSPFGSIKFCNQEILNRLYSLHSHPKAKKYIEKGLAIKIEVKDEE